MSEKYTYHQIDEQSSSARLNGKDDNPTVLVHRSDDRITVARLDKGTRTVHFTEGGKERYKTMPLEAFSDQWQGDLAEELAATRTSSEINQNSELEEVPLETRRELGTEALESVGAVKLNGRQGEFYRLLTDSDEEAAERSEAYLASQRAEWSDEVRASRARTAMDHKYNLVMNTTGGDSEAAQAAADRVWKNFGF